MTEWLGSAPEMMLRATLYLTLSACIVQALVWLMRPQSPAVHRWAWLCVLVQGLMWAPLSWNIPWYESAARLKPVAAADVSDWAAPVVSLGSGPADRFDQRASLEPKLPTPRSETLAANVALSFDGTRLLLTVWLMGMLVIVGTYGVRYLMLCRMLRQARVVDAT